MLEYLKLFGFTLHLETNGSKELGALHRFIDHVSMSPKQLIEDTHLEFCHDIKLLYPPIKEGIDYEHFKKFQHKQAFLQPIWDSDKKKTLEQIFNNNSLKLSPQLHKFMELE